MDHDRTDMGRVEMRLRHWGTKIDDIVSRAETAGAEYRNRVDALKTKHKEARLWLGKLRTAGGEKWGIFKTSVASTRNQIELVFKKLTNDSE